MAGSRRTRKTDSIGVAADDEDDDRQPPARSGDTVVPPSGPPAPRSGQTLLGHRPPSGSYPAVPTRAPSGSYPAVPTRTPSGPYPAVPTRTPSGPYPAVPTRTPSGPHPVVPSSSGPHEVAPGYGESDAAADDPRGHGVEGPDAASEAPPTGYGPPGGARGRYTESEIAAADRAALNTPSSGRSTEPAMDPNWRDAAARSGEIEAPSTPSPSPPPPPRRESRTAAGEIGVVEFGEDLIEESKAPPRRTRAKTERNLDPVVPTTPYERGRLPPPTSRPRTMSPPPSEVSPSTTAPVKVSTQPRVQTLPGDLPFNQAIRGRTIANGSNGMYFIGEHIGSGAYGDVYECTDEWDNPLVAKVLKPGLAFEEAQRQWQSEVMNLSQMRHPNITYIYDAFIYDAAFYIVVEKCLYSLDRVLHRADASWVPHIARDLLQALAFVHRGGHVHKDVHVGNVFVSVSTDVMDPNHTPRLQFKLGDLGIMRQEHDIRTVGTILAPWMRPPEAIDPARFGIVSKPTDIYHAALLLLAVLRREIYPFTEAEILAGLPRDFAERSGWPAAMALSNALNPYVSRRTQTPLEFWREVQSHFVG